MARTRRYVQQSGFVNSQTGGRIRPSGVPVHGDSRVQPRAGQSPHYIDWTDVPRAGSHRERQLSRSIPGLGHDAGQGLESAVRGRRHRRGPSGAHRFIGELPARRQSRDYRPGCLRRRGSLRQVVSGTAAAGIAPIDSGRGECRGCRRGPHRLSPGGTASRHALRGAGSDGPGHSQAGRRRTGHHRAREPIRSRAAGIDGGRAPPGAGCGHPDRRTLLRPSRPGTILDSIRRQGHRTGRCGAACP